MSSMTIQQTISGLIAVPAFLPATVCTGYLAGWFTNFHQFRGRTLVERLFWSVPLSWSVSTIASFLVGRFISLFAVEVCLWASAVGWVAAVAWDFGQRRRSRIPFRISFGPLSGAAGLLALIWLAFVIFSLVDFQADHELYMSLTMFDHAQRVNWTQSVLRSGIPPDNSFYFYLHPAPMRTYYFWYVICAAVSRMSRLPVRAVLASSCVWSGFTLAAIIGLYLKHFLLVGVQLRSRFLRSLILVMTGGLGICVNFWYVFHHQSLQIEIWAPGQITSWLVTLLYDPHHIVSLACCMFAFLLAWTSAENSSKREYALAALFISAALASAFGLSIYVTFAFFLLVMGWSVWHIAVERRWKPPAMLGLGGIGALVLILPFVIELARPGSGSAMEGGSLFAFAVRQTIAPDVLISSAVLSHFAAAHPLAALNAAKLLLLVLAYPVLLGFYLLIFLTYAVPAWHGRVVLTAAERSLLFLAAATIPIISFLGSAVLISNDFGWRASLFFLFPMLLLGSEVMTGWGTDHPTRVHSGPAHVARKVPAWLRSLTAMAFLIGVSGTVLQAALLRFNIPVMQWSLRGSHNSEAGKIPHHAFIAAVAYAKLDGAIPQGAVVQFNPAHDDLFWTLPDWLGIDHQVAIAGDNRLCGAVLGGDPAGCPIMAAAIDHLYSGATLDESRATCRQFGIEYLTANVYDTVWSDRNSWVWKLRPVVADPEFRAVDCTR
jgi:hypothetical protein